MVKSVSNYAFIDSQNLNLGVRSMGWMLDYKKFRLYLKNKYNVTEAYIFIGRMPGNQSLYTALMRAGYILIFKPTVAYVENGVTTMKGNVDAELVLYAAAKLFHDYDKAIIVSGDGDFYCLAEYLQDKDKLLRIITPNRQYSKLLRPYRSAITSLDSLKSRLEYVSKKPTSAVGRNLRLGRRSSRSGGRYETLGLPGNGDYDESVAKKAPNVNQPSKQKKGTK